MTLSFGWAFHMRERWCLCVCSVCAFVYFSDLSSIHFSVVWNMTQCIFVIRLCLHVLHACFFKEYLNFISEREGERLTEIKRWSRVGFVRGVWVRDYAEQRDEDENHRGRQHENETSPGAVSCFLVIKELCSYQRTLSPYHFMPYNF